MSIETGSESGKRNTLYKELYRRFYYSILTTVHSNHLTTNPTTKMPLWHVYHPPTTFTTAASKTALAAAFTKLYTDIGLPPFYVNVYFHQIPATDIYVGGQPQESTEPGVEPLARPFVRFVGEQIAVRMEDSDEVYAGWLDKVDAVSLAVYPPLGEPWSPGPVGGE